MMLAAACGARRCVGVCAAARRNGKVKRDGRGGEGMWRVTVRGGPLRNDMKQGVRYVKIPDALLFVYLIR